MILIFSRMLFSASVMTIRCCVSKIQFISTSWKHANFLDGDMRASPLTRCAIKYSFAIKANAASRRNCTMIENIEQLFLFLKQLQKTKYTKRK